MSELLPEKYNDSPLKKLFKRIRRFFLKYDNKQNDSKINEANTDSINMTKTSIESLKIENVPDYLKESKQENFIDNLIAHPELVEAISKDRLEQLLQFVTKKVENQKIILNELYSKL